MVAAAVEGESAGADLGELGEELADRVGVLGAGEVEEAVHLVVGEVGEQGLAGGAGVEGAAGAGCARRTSGWVIPRPRGPTKTMRSPTRTPTRTVQPRGPATLGHEPVIQRQRGRLVGAPGEDERRLVRGGSDASSSIR
jgi:hypothetical protein